MCVHSEAGDVCIVFTHKKKPDALMVNTFDIFLLTFHHFPHSHLNVTKYIFPLHELLFVNMLVKSRDYW